MWPESIKEHVNSSIPALLPRQLRVIYQDSLSLVSVSPSSYGSEPVGEGCLRPHLQHALACHLAHRVLSCPSLPKALGEEGFGLKPKQIAAERHTTVGVWLRCLWRLPRQTFFSQRSLPGSMSPTTNMCAVLWGLTGTSMYNISSYPLNYAGSKLYDSHFTDKETSSFISCEWHQIINSLWISAFLVIKWEWDLWQSCFEN